MSILLRYIFVLVFIFISSVKINTFDQDLVHTKLWVIEIIEHGEQEAKRIAKELNLIYNGGVGNLKGLYLLKERDGDDNKTSLNPVRSRRNVNDLYNDLSRYDKVRFVEPQLILKRTKRQTFNDPFYVNQWNLHAGKGSDACNFDINILDVWKRNVTGKGIVVTVVDDGLEHRHPDIRTNYDDRASYDYIDNDADPTPQQTHDDYNNHGTRCAGQIAATANNGVCGIGVAYASKLGGIRMFDGPIIDSIEASSFSHNPQYIDIYSVSWGPDDNGKTVDGPRTLAQRAIRQGARQGRDGLGSIYVWATGNGGRNSDHCGCDGFVNMIETVAISAIDYCNRIPFYAEPCTGVMAVTYSSGPSSATNKKITTTDLRGKCTDKHSGTSAAAPVAAGIIALALEANNKMTWRDIQHLVVRSSTKINLDHSSWIRNGNGLLVSDYFGFGSLNADKFVEMALHPEWETTPAQRLCQSRTMIINKRVYAQVPVIIEFETIACNDSERNRVENLEHVVMKLDIVSWPRGGLEIKLTSPLGTVAPILKQRSKDLSSNKFKNWPFMSVFFWDENPIGVWELEITQNYGEATAGILKSWSIDFYGTSGSNQPPGPFFTTTEHPNTVTDGAGSTFQLTPTVIIAICVAVIVVLGIFVVILMRVKQINIIRIQNNNTVLQFSNNGIEMTPPAPSQPATIVR